jgi:ParB family chromosome partitioning protein
LPYRGDLQAIAAMAGTSELAFVTVHPEGQATAVYRLDAEKLTLKEAPLPCGGRALLADDKTLWIAGSDGRLYRLAEKDKSPVAVGPELAAPAVAMALLADNRLAALSVEKIHILDRGTGKSLQTLALSEPGVCLAADPSGVWIAAGGSKGTVSVFTCEDKTEFVLSESDKLHEGGVTALLFEPSELRFYSAGLDQKLLLTHARGKLEPEDRGRGNTHAERLTALCLAPGDRFLSGGWDATVKTWPRAGAARPATLKDGVGRVVALAVVTVHNRQQLAIACQDNTLRFFVIDAAGKFGQSTAVVHDVYAWADQEFQQNEAKLREAAIRRLAELNDAPALERLTARVSQDSDHELRLAAARVLAQLTHPRVVDELEKHLKHRDEVVRRAVFEGLRQQRGASDLRPMDLALATGKADIGAEAITALEALASKDDQALARLVRALDGQPLEVRAAALTALERLHEADAPTANLLALASKQADIRRLALVRLFQRKLLSHSQVPAALRRAGEDSDPQVRHTAFLVSALTHPALAQTLRERDPELDRQFTELEYFDQHAEAKKPADESPAKKESKPTKKKAKAAAKTSSVELVAADIEPLLQAAASRMLDTCLRGARGLAVLEDPRALGLLMQLSRESDAAARTEVCRALGALEDPRSVKRLRSLLGDKAPEVRDAAFTALARIYHNEPLTAADAGLSAAHEDIRRRGLEILLREARKKAPAQDDDAWRLLRRALNDGFPGVRSEAFKASLNLGVGGGGESSLRFVLDSVHEDVRREALTEIIAQADQPWSQELLYDCFNDPAPVLRTEAFAFAAKRAKASDLGHFETALGSRWDDVRREAVAGLIKKHTQAAQKLLIRALDDEDLKVRQQALDGLVEEDAAATLSQALGSKHVDVRVRAAQALARRGDPAALQPLLDLATAEEPQDAPQREAHQAVVVAALAGLAELGDPAALASVNKLSDHKNPLIRAAAAKALVWTVRQDSQDAAQAALRNADPQVKHRAALALAYWGDVSAATLVFSEAGQNVLEVAERLSAALALERVAEDQLASLLDGSNETLRQVALALLLLLELKDHSGAPHRCLAALSSEHPRIRLAAARALECFAEPDRLREFVVQQINDRGDQPAWTLSQDDIETLAVLVGQASPLLRARTASLLLLWGEAKQDAWDQAWRIHRERYSQEIAQLLQQNAKRQTPALQYDAQQLHELAFGAYVGLVREQGAAKGRSSATGPLVLRVRQTALRRLGEMAAGSETFRDSARPVIIQSLSDPNQDVRMQAFEQLQALGLESSTLGAEAIASGHTDLAVRGMKLLTEGASKKDSVAILEQVMLSRTDDLALEAARLLVERQGAVTTAEKALTAAWATLPSRAVTWLAAEYDQDAKAKKMLHQALDSRFREVRLEAAVELARKKDPKAFDAAVAALAEPAGSALHNAAVNALQLLGDSRAADAFLDRIERDPKGTGQVLNLFTSARQFREPKIAPRLLQMMERKEWRRPAFLALRTISGYDQPLEDPDEERTDREWLAKQHPRHDEVLAMLAQRCLELGEGGLVLELVRPLRWAPSKQADPVLATLAAHSEPNVRHAAIEALGWRVRKRKADPAPLLKALDHREPDTKFHAAEALARSGRSEGLSTLLAAVELMSDVNMRQRAVQALGELADRRSLELLLKLAGEDDHALQQVAAESLGRLGQADKAEEIYKILERLAKMQGGLGASAIRGLRHLNTEAGWGLIRERLRDSQFYFREVAAEALGYNDVPATRDLLLETLARDPAGGDLVEAAYNSLRRLLGPDSLEPDYALLQNPELEVDYQDQDKAALDRVCRLGDPARILEILPRCHSSTLIPLAESLLRREKPPLKEAQAALESQSESAVEVAAQILGRAADLKSGKSLAAALTKWRNTWEARRRRVTQDDDRDYYLTGTLTPCLTRLYWAAGRLNVGEEILIASLTDRPGDPFFRPLRLAAVTALAESQPSAQGLEALAAAAVGDDAAVRALAASAVERWDAPRAAKLAEAALADRISLQRLTKTALHEATPALQAAAASLHYQGAVLPHLIDAGDVKALATVASDKQAPLATRLGAVEALSKLGQSDAEEFLVAIGKDQDNDEDLRKAAWRGRRRSQRARATEGQSPTA